MGLLTVHSGGVAIFKGNPESNDVELLLVSPWYNGPYGFPKGEVEKDEDPLEAALREAFEEVPGTKFQLLNLPPIDYEFLTGYDDRATHKHVTIFFARFVDGTVSDRGDVPHNWENKSARFINIDKILEGKISLSKSASESIFEAIDKYLGIKDKL